MFGRFMRMFGAIGAFPILAGLLVSSCNESAGPPVQLDQVDVARSATSPRHLRWNMPGRLKATAGSARGEIPLASSSDLPYASGGDSLALDSYDVSFWAVQDEYRYVQINYVDVINNDEHPFLRVEIEEIETLPDGTSLATGDSVQITVSVDPYEIRVELGPSGLQFGDAELEIWYGGAGGDLNGDGVVDDADSYIQKQLLELWYQANPDADWEPIAATHSIISESFETDLEHFSGYAVSW